MLWSKFSFILKTSASTILHSQYGSLSRVIDVDVLHRCFISKQPRPIFQIRDHH